MIQGGSSVEGSENGRMLHEQHIHNGSAGNGDEEVLSPEVKQNATAYAEKLRNAMASVQKVDVFQAVDNQHAEYGRCQIPA